MNGTRPVVLWLPMLIAAPRPITGRASSTKSGLFHTLAVAEGEKERLNINRCVRHLISKEWQSGIMSAIGS